MEFWSNHCSSDRWRASPPIVSPERVPSRTSKHLTDTLPSPATVLTRHSNDSTRTLQRSGYCDMSMEQSFLRDGIVWPILLYRHLLYYCLFLLPATSRPTAPVFPPRSGCRDFFGNSLG